MSSPFFDSSLPVEERIDWLLREMTIEEKLSCMASRMPELPRLGIRAFSVGGEAAHGVEARNDQNNLKVAEPTTSFPQPIGMSASWDPELVRQAGEAVGVEARVLYHRHPDRGLSRWAPTVDLERDPRWGRNEEGYGEDPLLTGKMASAYIQGMQGPDPDHLRVAATLKHFYANNTEQGRGWKSASIDPRNREELYLEPFRRCICEGGAEAIMTAYNKINGIPGMLNPEVKHILKEQYGLHHAVCDGGAMELVKNLHQYYGTHAETLAAAVRAGVDAMSDNPQTVEQAAREAYELHLISEEEIDGALRNMFRTKLRLGIYDEKPVTDYDQVTEEDLCCARHREISRKLAQESLVLLKNDGILPLAEDRFRLPAEGGSREISGSAQQTSEGAQQAACGAQKLALIGPLADKWYQDWYGGEPPYRTTLRGGIENICGTGTGLQFAGSQSDAGQSADGRCALPFCDGEDRVIFRCGEGGITVMEDETLRITDQPDVFVRQDWGEGRLTFYSVRTGKYLNLVLAPQADGQEPDRFELKANSRAPFSWFVTEIFHVHPAGDGQITLTTRTDTPVVVEADGSVVSRAAEPGTGDTHTVGGADGAPGIGAEPGTGDTHTVGGADGAPGIGAEPGTDGTHTVGGADGAPGTDAGPVVSGTAARFRMEIVESGLDKARALARQSDVVVLALGCSPMVCAKEEVDRGTIELPPAQEALLEAVWAENPNVVLVLFSNYPYALNWAKEHVPAILWSATGSQDMGTAAADALFGRVSPAGRLNMTWYRSDGDLPDIDDYDIIRGERTYRYFEGDVLFPFGHGLTYTTFAYGDLKAEMADEKNLHVTFSVTNTGDIVSDEVAQVYGTAPASRVKKPLRQLLGFQRIKEVQPGETHRVELLIPAQEFFFYDVISRKRMVEEGEYRIYAGRSSADLPLETALRIPGERTGLRDLTERIPADHYDDCENILLTEGHFGYTAVTPSEGHFGCTAAAPLEGHFGCTAAAPSEGHFGYTAVTPSEEKHDSRREGQETGIAPDGTPRIGRLLYRDCSRPEGKTLALHMRSDCGGSVEVLIDGKRAGFWAGNTRVNGQRSAIDERRRAEAAFLDSLRKPVWTDVRIELCAGDEAGEERCPEARTDRQTDAAAGKTHAADAGAGVTLELRLSGDVRLSFFRIEKIRIAT